MGTRAKPGDYDCYNKLKPDEPYFVLRAKDPVAPMIVEMWAAVVERLGATGDPTIPGVQPDPKLEEARKVAKAMGRWLEKQPKA